MSADTKKPNFLIAGVAKSGTTTLYAWLKEHPEVFMPRKETFFFMSSVYKNINKSDPEARKEEDIVYTPEQYLSLFNAVKNEKAIGEVGTGYLYYHKIAIPMIRKVAGDIKIIIVLRNPIQRAFSGYSHFIRNVSEPYTFEQGLEHEKERMRQNWDFMWYYKDLGFYYEQVKAFKDNFSNVKVYLFDEFKDEPALAKNMFEFLGIDSSFVPKFGKTNESGLPGNVFLQEMLVKPNHPIKSLFRPLIRLVLPPERRREILLWLITKNIKKDKKLVMKPETYEALRLIYRDDILKLQELINKDLSHWLKQK
ncbi:MAG: sulfotransferase [Deltaproteobacteria bacterium]|nr:sulfotransferase [Deltaproteobacteria bacterium]